MGEAAGKVSGGLSKIVDTGKKTVGGLIKDPVGTIGKTAAQTAALSTGGILAPLLAPGVFQGSPLGDLLGSAGFAGTQPKKAVNYGTALPTPVLEKYLSSQGSPLTGRVSNLSGQLDESGINAIKGKALQQGPSAWMRMALDKQGVEQRGLMNSAAQNAASGNAAARASLAMRGGLGGGAAERLASNTGNDLALARQGVLQQGALQRSDIGLADEANKMDLLKQLPGAQLGAAQYKTGVDQSNMQKNLSTGQFDIQNAINNLNNQNEFNKFKYGEQMKVKGAGMSAQAMENAGKK